MTASAILARNMRPPVCETRLGKPDDLAFVVDCWAQRELRYGDGKRTHGELKRHVRKLLGVIEQPTHAMPRELERLLIAHVVGDADSILGWACVERGGAALWPNGTLMIVDRNQVKQPPCVHYIYVRSAARRQGIARALVGATDIRLEYSHAAPNGIVVPATWTLNKERAVTR